MPVPPTAPTIVAPPAAAGAAAQYQQHPDDLIKKVDRKKAPVAATAEERAAAEQVSDTELAALKNQLPTLLWGDKPKEPTAEAKAATKAAEDAATAAAATKTAEEAATAAAKKASEDTPAIRVSKQPDATEIARITAAETARVLDERQHQRETTRATEAAAVAAKPAKDEAPAHFSDADKDTYDLLTVLSETDTKHKDSHKKFSTFVDKLAKYRKDWQAANAGQVFDPNGADHEDFYSANEPQVSQADLHKARVRKEARAMITEELTKEREASERRIAEVEARAVAPEIARNAAAAANAATGQFIAEIADETIKGHLAKSPDTLKEVDPVAFEVLNQHVGDLQRDVHELHTIVNRPGYFNGSNPVHKNISSFIEQQENRISRLPAQQQAFDNKQFATRAAYAKLPANQRAGYWTLSEKDVAHMLTQTAAHKAVQSVATERARIESMASKYGFVKGAAATAATQAAAVEAAKVAEKAAKPAGPAAAGGGATAPLAEKDKKDEPTTEKKLVGMLW